MKLVISDLPALATPAWVVVMLTGDGHPVLSSAVVWESLELAEEHKRRLEAWPEGLRLDTAGRHQFHCQYCGDRSEGSSARQAAAAVTEHEKVCVKREGKQ